MTRFTSVTTQLHRCSHAALAGVLLGSAILGMQVPAVSQAADQPNLQDEQTTCPVQTPAGQAQAAATNDSTATRQGLVQPNPMATENYAAIVESYHTQKPYLALLSNPVGNNAIADAATTPGPRRLTACRLSQ